MDLVYLVNPLLAWLIAGGSKFVINSIRARQLALGLIGYGGMPSNHTAIVSSMAILIALREGIAHPAFGVAITLAVIVMMDANSLRIRIGKQAEAINQLYGERVDAPRLRERMGHSKAEIAGGLVVGGITAWLMQGAALAGWLQF